MWHKDILRPYELLYFPKTRNLKMSHNTLITYWSLKICKAIIHFRAALIVSIFNFKKSDFVVRSMQSAMKLRNLTLNQSVYGDPTAPIHRIYVYIHLFCLLFNSGRFFPFGIPENFPDNRKSKLPAKSHLLNTSKSSVFAISRGSPSLRKAKNSSFRTWPAAMVISLQILKSVRPFSKSLDQMMKWLRKLNFYSFLTNRFLYKQVIEMLGKSWTNRVTL